ncbi:MAG: hypothetical protein AAGF78_10870 [Pseudomonadota bacterium]
MQAETLGALEVEGFFDVGTGSHASAEEGSPGSAWLVGISATSQRMAAYEIPLSVAAALVSLDGAKEALWVLERWGHIARAWRSTGMPSKKAPVIRM